MTIPEIIKELEEKMHTFIVQPTGGGKCSICGVSGTNTLDSLPRGEYGSYKQGFTPALAYLDSENLKDFITSRLSSLLNELVMDVEGKKLEETKSGFTRAGLDTAEKTWNISYNSALAEVALLIKAKIQ